MIPVPAKAAWRRELTTAVRDPAELAELLGLPAESLIGMAGARYFIGALVLTLLFLAAAVRFGLGRAVQAGGEPVIDPTARARYKGRIADLETDIDQAHERGDGEAAAVAQEELDALIACLDELL